MKYMRISVFWSYLFLLHIAFLLLVLSPDLAYRVSGYLGLQSLQPEMTRHYQTMLWYHFQIDQNVPEGAVLFIGDSITQALVVGAVTPKAVNYGIGSDTTVGVLNRIPMYKSINRARAIVLAIGVNDLKWRENDEILRNYKTIISEIPTEIPLIFNAIMPINESMRNERWNVRIKELNNAMQRYCSSRQGCYFIDIGGGLVDYSGNLRQELSMKDGLHLNRKGYEIWINGLKDILQTTSGNG